MDFNLCVKYGLQVSSTVRLAVAKARSFIVQQEGSCSAMMNCGASGVFPHV